MLLGGLSGRITQLCQDNIWANELIFIRLESLDEGYLASCLNASRPTWCSSNTVSVFIPVLVCMVPSSLNEPPFSPLSSYSTVHPQLWVSPSGGLSCFLHPELPGAAPEKSPANWNREEMNVPLNCTLMRNYPLTKIFPCFLPQFGTITTGLNSSFSASFE